MKAKGGTWTFGELYAFLANPRGYIPGTAMTFAGLSRGQQRADVIDFLHTLSDSPMPLPKAAEAAPAAAAAPAAKPAEAPKAAAPAPAAPRSAGEVIGSNGVVADAAGPSPAVLFGMRAAGRWWRTEKPT